MSNSKTCLCLGLLLGALVACIHIICRQQPSSEQPSRTGPTDIQAGTEHPEGIKHAVNSNNAFFTKKPRIEIEARRLNVSTNLPATQPNNQSWFMDGPSHPEAKTNVFCLGARSVQIVSRRPVNESAIYQRLAEQAVIDERTAERAAALRLKAEALVEGMNSNQVFLALGTVPSRHATLRGKEFSSYSSHPAKTTTDLHDRFPILYLTFDYDGKLATWRFSSR
jgi:hypothetical protein